MRVIVDIVDAKEVHSVITDRNLLEEKAVALRTININFTPV